MIVRKLMIGREWFAGTFPVPPFIHGEDVVVEHIGSGVQQQTDGVGGFP
jgi:hypothetical protein